MKLALALSLLGSLATFASAEESSPAPAKPKVLLSLAVMPGLTAKSGDQTATYGQGTMVLNLPALDAGKSIDVDVTVKSDKWKCTFTSEKKQKETAIFVLMDPMDTASKLLVRDDSVGVEGKCTKNAAGGGGDGSGGNGDGNGGGNGGEGSGGGSNGGNNSSEGNNALTSELTSSKSEDTAPKSTDKAADPEETPAR